MDEIAGLIDRIVACPASGTGDLTIKFGAILWLMEANESLLDLGDLRRLKRFRRDLGTIARNSGGRA